MEAMQPNDQISRKKKLLTMFRPAVMKAFAGPGSPTLLIMSLAKCSLDQ